MAKNPATPRMASVRREAIRLGRIAERIRDRLEALIADPNASVGGRDDPIALLLKLTQAVERIARLEGTKRSGERADRATLDAQDRAIVERYVAWRFRDAGVPAAHEGVPPPPA